LPAAFSPEIRFSPGENAREAEAMLRKSRISSDCNPMVNSGLTTLLKTKNFTRGEDRARLGVV
jgi:precorrin isomerase